jgi:hypothetical protein
VRLWERRMNESNASNNKPCIHMHLDAETDERDWAEN